MNNITKTFIYNENLIKYHEFGNGSPIIFLHGFGASSYCWRNISKPLSLKNKIILIDLKGFGLSDKPLDNNYSLNDQAEIILNFIQKNNFQNLTLIGHSIGGAIALLTYLKIVQEDSNPIKSLILIDSAGYEQDIPFFIRILRIPFINKISLSILPSHSSAKMILKKCFFDDKKITDEMIKTYADYMKLPGAHQALIKTASQIIPENIDEITKKYKDINAPVLIIWGKEDEIIPLSIGQKFKRDISNSKLIIIPKCGHIPHEERPLETVQIISDFLKTQ